MPCDSRTTVRTVFKSEHAAKMIEAARRLEWPAHRRGQTIQVETPRGTIEVSDGQTTAPRGASGLASALMMEYARVQFDDMIVSHPDRYEEIQSGRDEVVYNIRAR